MMHRTQILLDPADHRKARRRASELGISLSEYIRRLVAHDLGGPRPRADVAALFDLGDSGGSDVARDKDTYLGEAAAATHAPPDRTDQQRAEAHESGRAPRRSTPT
jgi:hypothetical protein